MAVIQEYYSSRFDPGAPALVSFLGGFMESRRELNQMAFKERLAGIDPRAAAMVEAAAIKRRTELEKLAQDAVIARESNDTKLKMAVNSEVAGLYKTAMTVGGGLAEKGMEVREKAASRETSRVFRATSGANDAANTASTTVTTSANQALLSKELSDVQKLDSIDKAVENALGGPGGVYSRQRDPDAQKAAELTLYADAYRKAKDTGNAFVKAEIEKRFGGVSPETALANLLQRKSPKEVAAELPTFGVDATGMVASILGTTRKGAQAALRGELGLLPMAGSGVQVAPTTGQAAAPAAPAGAEVVGSMPAAPGAVAAAPSLFEAEIAQAKALEEQARQQRLGDRGAVPYGQTEVGRANLLYGMPYYRSRPEYDVEALAPRAPVEAEEAEAEASPAGSAAVAGMEVPVQGQRSSLGSTVQPYSGPRIADRGQQPRAAIPRAFVAPEERSGAMTLAQYEASRKEPSAYVPLDIAQKRSEEQLLNDYIEDQRLLRRLKTEAARAAVIESMPTGGK